MKLRETVDTILACAYPTAPQSNDTLRCAPFRRSHLRLAWSNVSPGRVIQDEPVKAPPVTVELSAATGCVNGEPA